MLCSPFQPLKSRFIESIHNMKKPVISNEISPKFDRVQTTYILPEKQLSEIAK